MKTFFKVLKKVKSLHNFDHFIRYDFSGFFRVLAKNGLKFYGLCEKSKNERFATHTGNLLLSNEI